MFQRWKKIPIRSGSACKQVVGKSKVCYLLCFTQLMPTQTDDKGKGAIGGGQVWIPWRILLAILVCITSASESKVGRTAAGLFTFFDTFQQMGLEQTKFILLLPLHYQNPNKEGFPFISFIFLECPTFLLFSLVFCCFWFSRFLLVRVLTRKYRKDVVCVCTCF